MYFGLTPRVVATTDLYNGEGLMSAINITDLAGAV